MHDRPKESDWKAFRAMVPELRERYLRARNEELMAILGDSSKTPTDCFWAAEERTKETAKALVACLDGHTRSKMVLFITLMLGNGMMTTADLACFSEELRERLLRLHDLS